MSDRRKVVLTCAVTGENEFNRRHPCFPITPALIAAAAKEAAQAGASVVHLHVRDPETGAGSRSRELFSELVSRVRDTGIDIVINLTTGGGAYYVPDPENEAVGGVGTDMASPQERVMHIEDALPEMCSLDLSTLNQIDAGREFVYMNTTRTLRHMARRIKDLGVKPELEVFSAGDIEFGKQLVREGLVDGEPLFQFVLGVRWGAPADAETMLYMRNQLPQPCQWAALGVGRGQMPVVAQAALMGGNVRVGLEDNLYLERGVFASNGQLVERATRILEYVGCAVASPQEARAILRLRGAQ